MIREIKTNIGVFSSFSDLKKCMALEGHSSVYIYRVSLWDFTSLSILVGTYTYEEICSL